MSKFFIVPLFLVGVVVSAPRIARAEGFGAEGTYVPSGGISLSQSHFTGRSFLFINVAPELSYFVVDNWALGGGVSFGLDAVPGGMTTSWGARFTTGYYFPISDSIGVFPRAGISYSRYSSSPDVAIAVLGGSSDSHESVNADAGAPV